MAQTDRQAGLVASAAIKNPCRVATTANITLSAEQTIDGVAVVAGDRVLVKNQSDNTENGIYECDSGDWSRTKDFNGSYDAVEGTLVWVIAGSTQATTWYQLASTGDIAIGTDAITWTTLSNLLAASQTISAGDSGATADGSADELVVEDDANAGISILTPNANIGRLVFGAAADATGAELEWDHTNTLLSLGTTIAAGEVSIQTANGTAALRVDANQDMIIGGTSPSARLTVTDTVTGNILYVQSSAAGSTTAGPVLVLDRDDGGNGANGNIGGQIAFLHPSTTGVSRTIAAVEAEIDTATNASENGIVWFKTIQSGSSANRLALGNGLYTASESDQGADTINATSVYQAGVQVQRGWTWTAQTPTTSGTTVTLLNDVSMAGITEIEILIVGVGTDTNDQVPIVEIGPTSGVVSSGYLGVKVVGASRAQATDGFYFGHSLSSSYVNTETVSGCMRLTRWDASEHIWLAKGWFSNDDDAAGVEGHGFGYITLAGELTRIRLNTPGAAANFDEGEARVRYR